MMEFAELSVDGLSCELTMKPEKLRALRANPYLVSTGSLGKIVGMYEGREIGGEYVFPIWIKAASEKYRVLAGSTLSVDARYRNTGLGMDLPELRWQKSENGVALGAGLSQMALPVHQLLDYNVFLLPRLLMLWRSRPVVEMKLKGLVARAVSTLVDLVVAGYAVLMRLLARLRTVGCVMESVPPSDEVSLAAVARLIAEDGHAYGEVHDERWLKWHLTESFSEDGPAQLMVVKKASEIVGFWMTKRRFHAKASHRGFKNVWLGSIIEWQVACGHEKKLPWLLLFAALDLRKQGVDAVELPTDDECLQAFFRRMGWRTVGECNFVIKAGASSPLANNVEMSKQMNWRLRPAMGDNGLS